MGFKGKKGQQTLKIGTSEKEFEIGKIENIFSFSTLYQTALLIMLQMSLFDKDIFNF